ncbi:MAG: type 2 isopentenyl-diphosphate Delta-isomerase [Herpetosiphon sp.]
MADETTPNRKSDHIRIVLNEDVAAKGISTGFADLRLPHRALPEVDLHEIDLSCTLFGKRLGAPLLISSMTGGAGEAQRINLHLAEAAEHFGIAMGVGSQRAALVSGKLAATYQVRQRAPTALLFANLGAIQLNYGFGIDECRRAVDMIEADALILHLNALQEAVQPEGQTNFRGLLRQIEQVCRMLEVPVIAKEVGNGIGVADARRLIDAGVQAIDVAGAGGTSWSEVERFRHTGARGQRVASVFAGWGIPTTEAILEVRAQFPQVTLIASGGVRTGLDVAKCLALGADLAGSAAPHLLPATGDGGFRDVSEGVQTLIDELRVAMFLTGAPTLGDLRRVPVLRVK